MDTDELCREAWSAYLKNDRNQLATARALGIARSTLQGRIKRARKLGYIDGGKPTAEVPEFPDDDISIDELIDLRVKRFRKKQANKKAKTWFDVKMPDDEPTLIAFVGDPHLDDDGCDWPTLKRDVELLAGTPNCYAINMGDTTNNWVGKLLSKYANQETSKKTGYKLARWLLQDSGVNWLMWLLGNHDQWNDGTLIYKEMARNVTTVFDWQARFNAVFPNGRKCPIWCAHGFKGNSLYNPGHGALRAAKFGQIPV